MVRAMSRAQRRERFLQAAVGMFEAMEEWYDQHPEATFGEIEQQARQQRAEFMGQALALWINGRDTGVQVEPPRCPSCQAAMEFKDYRERTVRGLEGDSRLERAYYVCPQGCQQTLFPPGPTTATEEGSVE
jgi:hypothetical protein